MTRVINISIVSMVRNWSKVWFNLNVIDPPYPGLHLGYNFHREPHSSWALFRPMLWSISLKSTLTSHHNHLCTPPPPSCEALHGLSPHPAGSSIAKRHLPWWSSIDFLEVRGFDPLLKRIPSPHPTSLELSMFLVRQLSLNRLHQVFPNLSWTVEFYVPCSFPIEARRFIQALKDTQFGKSPIYEAAFASIVHHCRDPRSPFLGTALLIETSP